MILNHASINVTMLALARLDHAGTLLSVPSLSSLSLEGRKGEEQGEAYHDELMMPLMSMLLDHLSDGG